MLICSFTPVCVSRRGMRMNDRRTPCAILLLVLLTLATCRWVGENLLTNRTPCDYYLPEGFTGWAEVHYGVTGALPLLRSNGRYVIRFSEIASFQTSSKFEEGEAVDRYFYYSPRGVRVLSNTEWGGGGYIWAGEVHGSTREPPIWEKFFVGTERQYYKAVHDPRGD